MLVSLRFGLVQYGFVEVLGCFHGPSCIVLKMLQVFMRVSGGGVRGLWIPLKIAEMSVPLQCWSRSTEESQSCQLSIQCWAFIGLPANSMAFRW